MMRIYVVLLGTSTLYVGTDEVAARQKYTEFKDASLEVWVNGVHISTARPV